MQLYIKNSMYYSTEIFNDSFLIFFFHFKYYEIACLPSIQRVTVLSILVLRHSGTLAFVKENCGSFFIHIRWFAHAHFDFYGNKQYGGQRWNIVQTLRVFHWFNRTYVKYMCLHNTETGILVRFIILKIRKRFCNQTYSANMNLIWV